MNLEERQANRAKARTRARIRRHSVPFERELRRSVGRPRRLGETIMEYTTAAKAKLAHRETLGSETCAAFAGALYSPTAVDEVLLDNLRDRVKAFKKARRDRRQ